MKSWLLPVACALLIAGCNKKTETTTNETTAVPADGATPAAAASPAATPSPVAAAPFDMAKVPVSNVQLGAFPYLALPTGYEARSEKTLEISRYPVWVGDHFQWVEGKAYDSSIGTAEGKDFSLYELQKNVEALVNQAGGVRVAEGEPGSEAIDGVESARQAFDDSIGSIGGKKVQTYLIHQKDRDIWIQLAANDSYGAWGIVEAKPFTPSAKLAGPAPAATPAQ